LTIRRQPLAGMVSSAQKLYYPEWMISQYDSDATSITGVSSTSYINGTPEVSVTWTAPPCGQALIIVGGDLSVTGSNNSIFLCPETYEGTNASGTVIRSAVDQHAWTNCGTSSSTAQLGCNASLATEASSAAGGILGTSLKPGHSYFTRVVHRVDGGTTGVIGFRNLIVVPLPFGKLYSPGKMKSVDTPPPPFTRIEGGISNITGTRLTNPNPGDPEAIVTFTAPSSGRALVVVGGGIRDNTGTGRLEMHIELREDSKHGRLIVDPRQLSHIQPYAWSNAPKTSTANNPYQYGSRIGFLGAPATEALEPGRTYWCRAMMSPTTATLDISTRDLYVIGVG